MLQPFIADVRADEERGDRSTVGLAQALNGSNTRLTIGQSEVRNNQPWHLAAALESGDGLIDGGCLHHAEPPAAQQATHQLQHKCIIINQGNWEPVGKAIIAGTDLRQRGWCYNDGHHDAET